MISIAMRDVLIRHLDGNEVIIIRSAMVKDNYEAWQASAAMNTTQALLARGLLRPVGSHKPYATVITDSGRAELAKALADWADAMVRAKWELPPLPFQSREDIARTKRHAPRNP
jgi:hypothetical protein